MPLDLEAIIDKMIAKSPSSVTKRPRKWPRSCATWIREAGSGRGFSRMSALMAEALRAKQHAGQEASRPKSEAVDEPELKLVSLDDEPAHSRSTPGSKSGGSGKLDTSKAASAEAKEKAGQPNRKSPAAGTKMADPADDIVLPTIRADLRSAKLPEALMTEPLPPETGDRCEPSGRIVLAAASGEKEACGGRALDIALADHRFGRSGARGGDRGPVGSVCALVRLDSEQPRRAID